MENQDAEGRERVEGLLLGGPQGRAMRLEQLARLGAEVQVVG
jgi:hypothetical protein